VERSLDMAAEKEPLGVGTSKYLLFDEALTQEKEGFVLTMNPAIRTEEPVLSSDSPWEIGGIAGDSAATRPRLSRTAGTCDRPAA